MSMFKIFDISGSAVSSQSQRLNTVASNLANVDTVAGPDGKAYKAREVTFQTVLMNTGDGAPGQIPIGTGSTAELGLKYAAPSQTSLDSNTVDMDRERASFVENSVKYEATLRFINTDVRTMLDAMKSPSPG